MPDYDFSWITDDRIDVDQMVRDLIAMEVDTLCPQCGITFRDIPYNNGSGVVIVTCPHCYRDFPA